jgi:hypothetical protein
MAVHQGYALYMVVSEIFREASHGLCKDFKFAEDTEAAINSLLEAIPLISGSDF